MTEHVTLIIDDRQVQVPKGTLIIEAAESVGIRIPRYCYHSGLPVVGSCRMCLVEIEKAPKLQPSCATPVAEGMIVRTRTPATLRNRRFVLEFLLANHPIDCPVCDQAGECELQNYYMEHGLYDTRHNENKTRRKKAYPIGPHIILDQERCILCTRCVRFTREISKTAELGVMDRGHRSEIDVFPGVELANPYSGNVADICPVGALTDRDFRFKCRVWFLGSAPSICPGCSRGCNIEIHYNARFNPRYHDQRVQRLKPRYNKNVNGHWICDEGRYAYHSIDAPNRLRTPQMKQGDRFQETTWTRAIQEAVSTLKHTLALHGPKEVAVLASAQLSNEELYLIRKIFRDHLNIERIESRFHSDAAVYSDDFLITADKNPNTRGLQLFLPHGSGGKNLLRACAEGDIRFLYIFQHDLTLGYDPQEVAEALGKVDCIVFQGAWNHPTAALADIRLPSAVYAEKEGTFINVANRIQRFQRAILPIGDALPDLEILHRLGHEIGVPLVGASAADVLLEIGQTMDAFAGITWQTVGSGGQPLTLNSGEHYVG